MTFVHSIVRLYQARAHCKWLNLVFAPNYAQCSKTCAKPIFLSFWIFSTNKFFCWTGRFFDKIFSFGPILMNIFLDTIQKMLRKRKKCWQFFIWKKLFFRVFLESSELVYTIKKWEFLINMFQNITHLFRQKKLVACERRGRGSACRPQFVLFRPNMMFNYSQGIKISFVDCWVWYVLASPTDRCGATWTPRTCLGRRVKIAKKWR